MPCNGIAVQTAQIGIDLEARLSESAEERQALADYLRENGVQGVGEMDKRWLFLEVAGGNLAFDKDEIVFSEETRSRQAANARKALALAQDYAAELVQAEVIETFRKAGLRVWNVCQTETGAVLFDFES